MAQVQQASASALNGIPEKNGNGLNLEESSIGMSHVQNGSLLLHGTPTKDFASTSIETDDLQLSPGDLRRRSTRASALKAQEKIKLKDDIVQGPQKRLGDHEEIETEDGSVCAGEQSATKKRRLENGREFDQTCFRFGLRANDEGDVYAMTDESENSSIHESEMEIVRYHYEKMLNKEPDAEQLRERLKMRKDAENALREEEAKLLVLRKMKDSQNRAITKLAADTKAADLAEAAAAAASAYKPVVANPANGKGVTNGKAALAAANSKTMAGLANLSLAQQLELLQKLSSQSPAAKQAYLLAKKNPSQTTHLFGQLIAINNAQVQKHKEAEAAAAASNNFSQQAQITQSKLLHHQQTPAQRIQAARLAFRAQADKQLMTIPIQKVQPHEITFLPNPNASAFLALHGLDQVVQSVLKDKSNDKVYDGPAYECEECKTDCAHTWKAIGSSQDDLHLYCENCVRSAQKRKNKADQTSLLKRAFQKISAQEKEFEKKIAEGQLEQSLAPEAKPNSSSSATPIVATSSTATVSSTPLGPRIPNIPSSSGTSTPTSGMKTSTPLSSTPSKSSSSSNAKKAVAAQQQQMLAMQLMNNPMMRNSAMLQQMMFQMAQVQAVQAAAATRNIPNMALLMQAAQAQAAAQAAQAQAQAQAQAKSARDSTAQQQQQQTQAMLFALMNQPGAQQHLAKLTPQQQKSIMEALSKKK